MYEYNVHGYKVSTSMPGMLAPSSPSRHAVIAIEAHEPLPSASKHNNAKALYYTWRGIPHRAA